MANPGQENNWKFPTVVSEVEKKKALTDWNVKVVYDMNAL